MCAVYVVIVLLFTLLVQSVRLYCIHAYAYRFEYYSVAQLLFELAFSRLFILSCTTFVTTFVTPYHFKLFLCFTNTHTLSLWLVTY